MNPIADPAIGIKPMAVIYLRVSTKDQSLDLQVDALRRAGCTKVYQEVVSGATVCGRE